MTKSEYAVLLALFVALGLFSYNLSEGITKVHKAGGWSKVFIDIGKEIKHISNEINKD